MAKAIQIARTADDLGSARTYELYPPLEGFRRVVVKWDSSKCYSQVLGNGTCLLSERWQDEEPALRQSSNKQAAHLALLGYTQIELK